MINLTQTTMKYLNALPMLQLEVLSGDKENVFSKEDVMSINRRLATFGYSLSAKAQEFLVEGSFSKNSVIESLTISIDELTKVFDLKNLEPLYETVYFLSADIDGLFDKAGDIALPESRKISYVDALQFWCGLSEEEAKAHADLQSADVFDLKELDIVTLAEVEALAANKLFSKVVPSKEEFTELDVLLETLENHKVSISKTIQKENFQNKELKNYYILYMFNKHGIVLDGYVDTATDALRLAAELSGVELSAKHIQFKKFNNKEIHLIFSYLEKLNYTFDDMWLYRKPWKKFYKLFGNRVGKAKYPKVKKFFNALFDKKIYGSKMTTRGAIQQSYLDFSDDTSIHNTAKLISLLNTRPGEFARRLLSILNKVDFNSYDYIMFNMMNVFTSVDSKVLWQLVARLRALEEETTRSVAIKGVYQKLDETITNLKEQGGISYIFERLMLVLGMKYAQKEFLGKVYISPTLGSMALSTSMKGTSNSTELTTRYSWFELPKGFDVVRFFQFWTNDGNGRTDLDLSTKLFKKTENGFGQVGMSAFTRLQDEYVVDGKKVSFKHSGDYQNAPEPDGAIEYVDIRGIEHLLNSDEEHYLIMYINNYNQDSFLPYPSNRAGVMLLSNDEAASKELYQQKSVFKQFQLVSEVRGVIPLIFDFKQNRLIWVDMPKEIFSHSSVDRAKLEEFLSDVLGKVESTPSIHSMLTLNALARGMVVDNPDEADVIFDENTPISELLSHL
jgi:hypothetical protein